MTQEDIRAGWARMGAQARLAEIESERETILVAFPELRRRAGRSIQSPPGSPIASSQLRATASPVSGRKRRKLTRAWRAKLAAAAKRRWAEAKKAGRTRL